MLRPWQRDEAGTLRIPSGGFAGPQVAAKQHRMTEALMSRRARCASYDIGMTFLFQRHDKSGKYLLKTPAECVICDAMYDYASQYVSQYVSHDWFRIWRQKKALATDLSQSPGMQFTQCD